jgi:hypothetical protein
LKSDKKSNSPSSNNLQNQIVFTESHERVESRKRDRNLIIICGPNGAPFEQFCRNVNFKIIFNFYKYFFTVMDMIIKLFFLFYFSSELMTYI